MGWGRKSTIKHVVPYATNMVTDDIDRTGASRLTLRQDGHYFPRNVQKQLF